MKSRTQCRTDEETRRSTRAGRISGLKTGMLIKAMADLEALGVARNDVTVTVFVHVAVEGHSQQRLAQAARLETGLGRKPCDIYIPDRRLGSEIRVLIGASGETTDEHHPP